MIESIYAMSAITTLVSMAQSFVVMHIMIETFNFSIRFTTLTMIHVIRTGPNKHDDDNVVERLRDNDVHDVRSHVVECI